MVVKFTCLRCSKYSLDVPGYRNVPWKTFQSLYENPRNIDIAENQRILTQESYMRIHVWKKNVCYRDISAEIIIFLKSLLWTIATSKQNYFCKLLITISFSRLVCWNIVYNFGVKNIIMVRKYKKIFSKTRREGSADPYKSKYILFVDNLLYCRRDSYSRKLF